MAVMDIIILGLLLYGFIKGIWRGFFIELAAFVSLFVGLYVSVMFSDYAGAFISEYVSWEEKYIKITAFVITFALAVVGVVLLGKLLTKIAKFTLMGWLNKLLGGIFGFLKWLLILSVLVHLFTKLNTNNNFADKKTLDESWCYNPILDVYGVIAPMFSEWSDSFWEQSETEEQEQQTPPPNEEEEDNDSWIDGLDKSI